MKNLQSISVELLFLLWGTGLLKRILHFSVFDTTENDNNDQLWQYIRKFNDYYYEVSRIVDDYYYDFLEKMNMEEGDIITSLEKFNIAFEEYTNNKYKDKDNSNYKKTVVYKAIKDIVVKGESGFYEMFIYISKCYIPTEEYLTIDIGNCNLGKLLLWVDYKSKFDEIESEYSTGKIYTF